MTLSITKLCFFADGNFAECHVFFTMLNVIMLSVVMLNVVKMSITLDDINFFASGITNLSLHKHCFQEVYKYFCEYKLRQGILTEREGSLQLTSSLG
jgi:hypothetical protein